MNGPLRQTSWTIGCIILGVAVLVQPSRGDDEKSEKLRTMRAIAEKVSVEKVSTASGPVSRIALLAEPVFLWDDAARHLSEGSMWAWGKPGRPVALLTTSIQQKPTVRFWVCEMTSLSERPLAVVAPNGKVWEPGPSLEIRPIPKAQAPASDESKRLRQMKELARRFKAFEFFEPAPEAAPERYELRLLIQPVQRYSDAKSGLIDGALFLLSYGQNPEVVLLLEARREGDHEATWFYGLARTGAARFIATLDDAEVWQQPRLRQYGLHDPYRIFLMPVVEESNPKVKNDSRPGDN